MAPVNMLVGRKLRTMFLNCACLHVSAAKQSEWYNVSFEPTTEANKTAK